MSATPHTSRDVRPRVIGALRLNRVQLIVAGILAVVLAVVIAVDHSIFGLPWVTLAALTMTAATVLAVVDRRVAGVTMSIIVPALDLAAFAALFAEPLVPRNVAILMVMPAFWLGVTAGRLGIGMVMGASGVLAAVMAVRATDSVGVVLAANAVGAVLVPISLISTAWFAYNYSRTIERQQLAILKREREKAALAKERAADATLLDAIFETARVGLLLIDADGNVKRVNSTLAQHPVLAGDSLTELRKLRIRDLESRREIAESASPFMRAARGEAFDNVVFWIERADRDTAMSAVTVSSRPIVIDGEFHGSIASVDDVTTYMRMLEDRDDFVALVSHELRTPLTSIAGFLELVLDEELPESLRSWLLIVQRNGDRLRALVEDLLIVGEMSRGEVRLEHESVDLRMLAAEAVHTLDHRARRRGVRLRLLEGGPAVVQADPRRITQVMENLISNAIKYTRDDGTVDVHVDADGREHCVRVVDDGEGVPAAEALRVFERFYRSTSARSSGVQGAGLGLWICRMIIDAHGGSISFASEPGKGSAASFRLPARG
ncbi:sensor histidine kinase [Agrococcus sp. Ld7]|uniref:sensor histidine kinase n=1 Tax=Agrococcus sp. Ld7 TaxID=649148 RepID=UPI00386B2457